MPIFISHQPIPSKIEIEGNILDYGLATDGSTGVGYSYSVLLQTNANCIIDGNVFQGSLGNATSGAMLQLTDDNICNITNNQFIRNNVTLQYYINGNGGTNDHNIRNNVFDQTSPDNNNSDNLVGGITETSHYRNNKNQGGYVSIPLYMSTTIVGNGSVPVTAYTVSDFLETFLDIGGTAATWNSVIQLNSYVPHGAHIDFVALGVANDDVNGNIGVIGAGVGTSLYMGLLRQISDVVNTSQITSSDPTSSFAGGILDVFNVSSNNINFTTSTSILDCSSSSVVNAMYQNTSYMYLPTVASATDFTIGGGYNIMLHWGGHINIINGSETLLYYSAAVVRYVW